MQPTETLHWSVESICRIYGVPLQLLQYPEATSHAQSEVLMQSWLRVGLGPLIARIEAGLQRLIVGNTTFVKFNIDGLLRPMTKERYDAYAVAVQNGWLSLDEIRSLEDRPPLPEGGNQFWKPLNIGTVGADNTRNDAETAGVLVRAGFDPLDSAKVAGLPEMKHTGAAPVTLQADVPVVPQA